MAEQFHLDSTDRADNPAQDATRDDGTMQIAPDFAYKRLAIVNVVFCGAPDASDGNWTLINAGMPHTANATSDAEAKRIEQAMQGEIAQLAAAL